MTLSDKLISGRQILKRTRVLSKEIRAFYRNKPMIILGILNGALFFLVDLLRELRLPVQIETWRLRSYPGKSTTSSGKIQGLEESFGDFKGKHVLIVDDILDTGLTLWHARKRLIKLGAKSVRICVMLRKRKKRIREVTAKWAAFDIKDEFVVGYGLDYDGYYRELPDVRLLQE